MAFLKPPDIIYKMYSPSLIPQLKTKFSSVLFQLLLLRHRRRLFLALPLRKMSAFTATAAALQL